MSNEKKDDTASSDHKVLNEGDSFLESYFDELLSTKNVLEKHAPDNQILCKNKDDIAREPASKKMITTRTFSVKEQSKDIQKKAQTPEKVKRAFSSSSDVRLNQKVKLQALLDQGLQVATTPKPTTTAPDISIKREHTHASETQLKTHTQIQIKSQSKIKENSKSLQIETMPATEFFINSSVNENLQWHENGRPLWAQERFEALLFNVSGLTLAVPLICLGQIQPIDNNLTPIFGQSEWFLGILNTSYAKIKTINTSLFVMPEKYKEQSKAKFRYVITIDGMPWGLAVDEVNQPISLLPEQVKWRGHRSSRPWLAGTVKSAMCALIDIPNMGKMLLNSEQKSD